jgi:carbonic anhydrase/acetyltransferase-like protein (isoleucine patch superfamily)
LRSFATFAVKNKLEGNNMSIRSFQGIHPQIANSAYIDQDAVVIGDVTIGEDSSIWPTVVVRGDVHKIIIGHRSNIQDGSVLHVTADNEYNPGGFPLTIGDGVTVGHKAILHACTVGDYALIGMGATVLDGAKIGAKALIGAGSVVAPGKELEGGYLWLGSPAKKMRELTEKELAYLEFSAQHYVNLKNKHTAEK